MIPLNSEVSCSSVHGSLRGSYEGGIGALGALGVSSTIAFSSVSMAGVEAAVDFVFFFGGIVGDDLWLLRQSLFGVESPHEFVQMTSEGSRDR